jgi:hypothetical protein
MWWGCRSHWCIVIFAAYDLGMRFLLPLVCFAALNAQTPEKDHTLGYDNTPIIPYQKWRVHDVSRPRPPMVTPGATVGAAPSDAIVLFNGTDLSQWTTQKWKVEDGYVEVVPGTGGLATKEKFGDVQLHIEWAAPAEVEGKSQSRGNSGVLLMNRYEVQVLDCFENPTYADGQAASIYGQWPPLVNACRKPGEWQTYDIVWEAPRFEGETLVKPAFVTVFHNGVVMHNRQQVIGTTPHAQVGIYKAHGDDRLQLQNHGDKVRYRNIWIRKMKGYDQQ